MYSRIEHSPSNHITFLLASMLHVGHLCQQGYYTQRHLTKRLLCMSCSSTHLPFFKCPATSTCIEKLEMTNLSNSGEMYDCRMWSKHIRSSLRIRRWFTELLAGNSWTSRWLVFFRVVKWLTLSVRFWIVCFVAEHIDVFICSTGSTDTWQRVITSNGLVSHDIQLR